MTNAPPAIPAFSSGIPGRGLLGLPAPVEVLCDPQRPRTSIHTIEQNIPPSRTELIESTIWMAIRLGQLDWLDGVTSEGLVSSMTLKGIAGIPTANSPYDWKYIKYPLQAMLAHRPETLPQVAEMFNLDEAELRRSSKTKSAMAATPAGRKWLAAMNVSKSKTPRIHRVFGLASASVQEPHVDPSAITRATQCDELVAELSGPTAAAFRAEMASEFTPGRVPDRSMCVSLYAVLRAALYDSRDDVLQVLFDPSSMGSPLVTQAVAHLSLALSYPFLLALQSAAERDPKIKAGLLAAYAELLAERPGATSLMDLFVAGKNQDTHTTAALLFVPDLFEAMVNALAKNPSAANQGSLLFIGAELADVQPARLLAVMLDTHPELAAWRSEEGRTLIHYAMLSQSMLTDKNLLSRAPPSLTDHFKTMNTMSVIIRPAPAPYRPINANFPALLPTLLKHPEQLTASNLMAGLTNDNAARFAHAVMSSQAAPSAPPQASTPKL